MQKDHKILINNNIPPPRKKSITVMKERRFRDGRRLPVAPLDKMGVVSLDKGVSENEGISKVMIKRFVASNFLRLLAVVADSYLSRLLGNFVGKRGTENSSRFCGSIRPVQGSIKGIFTVSFAA